ILDEHKRRLVRDEHALLDELRVLLAGFDAAADDLQSLREAATTLDEMFLLVVIGEFNAGKSAVINALVGETVAPEGITPTTASVTVLRHGEARAERVSGESIIELIHPAPFLRSISIVDTPGTNAIIRRHEEITARYAPRADLVLFVTSADRPFTESERAFMERLRGWGKGVVVVLNKTDLLSGPEQVDELEVYIKDNARALLGFNPRVLAVSARLALQSLGIENAATRAEMLRLSGFEALRRYVFETLDEESRVRLKLLNPLGVAESVMMRYAEASRQRDDLLAEDRKTEDNIERQLQVFQEDMERDFRARLLGIDNIVLEMNERATRFFETTMRLGRIPDLLNGGRIKAEFEREVIADSAQRIDDAVRDLIDWAVDAEARLWQGVTEYLARRRQAGSDDGALGVVTGSSFAQDRRAVLENAVRAARRVVEQYDRETEGRQLASS
ncbi:MAG: dynamin family protein, partial [Ktedonobacterales bacterium]